MDFYLDYQMIVYLQNVEDKSLSKIVENLKLKGSRFLFSPAHLEEIAVSSKRGTANDDLITSKIDFLTTLCGNNSLRPVSEGILEIYNEPPVCCYGRVINNYHLNDLAESLEYDVISDANNNPAGSPITVNNNQPEKILYHVQYYEMLLLALMKRGLITVDEMRDSLVCLLERKKRHVIMDRHDVLVMSINILANWLEKIGFYREGINASRSRLHDVSHMIYGSYSDFFVSNDKKLLNKTRAIYSFLTIKTKVLSMDEFIKEYGCDVNSH